MNSIFSVFIILTLFSFSATAQQENESNTVNPKFVTEDELMTAMLADESIKCEWSNHPASDVIRMGEVQTTPLENYCSGHKNDHNTLCSGNIRCTLSPEFIRSNIDGNYTTGYTADLFFTDVQCVGKREGGKLECGLGGMIETCLPLEKGNVAQSVFIDSKTTPSGRSQLEVIGNKNRQSVQ